MRTLVVLALMAAATALAAPAYADPNPDAGFLATLDKASITYHSGPEAVAAAHQVCDWINSGQARPDVIKTVASGNPGFSMSDAADVHHPLGACLLPRPPGATGCAATADIGPRVALDSVSHGLHRALAR